MRVLSAVVPLAAYAWDQMEPRPAMGGIARTPAGDKYGSRHSKPESDVTKSGTWWADLTADQQRGREPPYVPPKTRTYDTSIPRQDGKINVHLVPHSHDDTGWLVTVDQYYFHEVFYIIETVVDQLLKDKNRRFIYVEVAFFARWWEEQPEERRNATRTLVNEGRLEFINGGWCMHDEAAPHYVEMVDQTTRGHQFLIKNFGRTAVPRGTWQIDPFGHSSTNAWLLASEAGMDSLYWGRTDFQDFNVRLNESRLEWVWQASQSLGSSARVFAGQLFGTGGGGYGSWVDFDDLFEEQVQDDPHRHGYNVDKWVDRVVGYAKSQAAHTQTDHQMWAVGNDFQYQNAVHYYHNLDKLIHHVNKNGTINIFYSTPTAYTEAKNKAGAVWEVRQDDIFPLADGPHQYWSGYFTSRPALKKQVRLASNFLNAARQLEVLSGVTAEEVDTPTLRPSPAVGTSWTDSLEGTVGVATHHDGMSGTERQAVADDYAQRISESHAEVEAGVGLSLQRLLGLQAQLHHCNCNTAGNCLNMSVCAFTTDRSNFSVVAWNPRAQNSRSFVALPVKGEKWTVTGPGGESVASQVVALDNRTAQLPEMYLNRAGMSSSEISQALAQLRNNASHVLSFQASVPALGYGVFKVETGDTAAKATSTRGTAVTNGYYTLTIDPASNEITQITNHRSNVTSAFSIQWGYYRSSTGGCTPGTGGLEPWKACSAQASGAYIFRPNTEKGMPGPFSKYDTELFYPGPSGKPTLEVVEGPVVTEVRQVYSDWVTHVVRLVKDKPFVEVEWTVGPIPKDTPWADPASPVGKEIAVRYHTGLKSDGRFYTDSNGREMVPRDRNKRGPSYPPLKVSEPVAGNYYPVNTAISVDDGDRELVVLTDVTQGGTSLTDGTVELMVHRRTIDDDSRGVFEGLSETMCGCESGLTHPFVRCDCPGLTVRGKHWLVFDVVAEAHAARRDLMEELNFPPVLAFGDGAVKEGQRSWLATALPRQVKLQTLTSNYAQWHDGQVVLRLSHQYAAGEHAVLSREVSVDLGSLFGGGFRVRSASEMSLTSNQDRATMEKRRLVWNVTDVTGGAVEAQLAGVSSSEKWEPMHGLVVTLRPMEVKTFLIDLERPGEAFV